MTTVASVMEQTKRWLFTGGREQRNKLTSTIANNATSATLTYAMGGIAAGAKISMDLEDMHVWAVSGVTAGSTATIERGQYGSTAASHTAGAIVFVNPKFSNFEIFTELNNELAALSAAGIYQAATVDLTYNPAYQAYDLTSVTAAEDILALSYESLTGEYVPLQNWRLQRDLPTGDFPSGFALTITDYVDPGQTVRVAYRSPLTAVTTTTDDVTTLAGLPSTAVDLLAMGTALRLSASREVRRNFTEAQGDTRRATEVPAGANNAAPAGLRQQYITRLAQEVGNLKRRYPPKRP